MNMYNSRENIEKAINVKISNFKSVNGMSNMSNSIGNFENGKIHNELNSSIKDKSTLDNTLNVVYNKVNRNKQRVSKSANFKIKSKDTAKDSNPIDGRSSQRNLLNFNANTSNINTTSTANSNSIIIQNVQNVSAFTGSFEDNMFDRCMNF